MNEERHADWHSQSSHNPYDAFGDPEEFVCSKCKSINKLTEEFCPMCGSIMDGVWHDDIHYTKFRKPQVPIEEIQKKVEDIKCRVGIEKYRTYWVKREPLDDRPTYYCCSNCYAHSEAPLPTCPCCNFIMDLEEE